MSFHGVALNIDPDLADFELLDAVRHARGDLDLDRHSSSAGRPERPSTAARGPGRAPLRPALAEQLGAELTGELPA